ncbi:EamA family transporter RarD [Thermobifida halotolerans]|uniref:EamA family transporter RarD n=1 Tax=Thermobifida halotolerans TaxID=483545 RepID=A0A399G127_9ACTN|nr:EamA family transporter RarD [Thermobifida halotolerans]
MPDSNKGVLYGASAYFLWGFLPLYWPLITPPATPTEALFHRMIWSLVVVVGVLLVRRDWRWLDGLLRSPRQLLLLTAATLLITLNWGCFIIAVTSGHTLQSSLAYFMNPLVSVALGMLVLRERLSRAQWVAVALGVVAVAVLALDYDTPPWLAIAMALAFAGYGLLKKSVRLDGVQSLAAETAIMFLPGTAVVVYLESTGSGTFLSVSPTHSLLLVGTGVLTAVPLMLFGAAAQRLPLSMVGLLQFIAPVMHFLIAWLVFGEELSAVRWFGFVVVWAALAVFVVDMLGRTRRASRPPRAAAPEPTAEPG